MTTQFKTWKACKLKIVTIITCIFKLCSLFVSAKKLLSIRLFEDSAGKRWQKNVKEQEFEILCVSQFTLYNRLKGNKPDFHLAMHGPEAANLYNQLLEKLRRQYTPNRVKGEARRIVKSAMRRIALQGKFEVINSNFIL